MKLLHDTTIFKVKFRADPLGALQFLRALGRMWTIWPVDSKASWKTKIYHECSLWFIITNLFITWLTLWISVCDSYKYPVIMANNLATLMIATDSCSHLIFYRINRSDLSILLQKVFDFLQTCGRQEKLVIKKYYKRFLLHYIILIILYITAALAFFCGALILDKRFPIDERYPFSIKSGLAFSIIYTHQIYSIIQNSTIIMIDFLVITLFWFAGARFSILRYKIRSVENSTRLKQYIDEHQQIIRFVQYAVHTVRFIIYKTVAVVAIILISAGIQLLYYDAKIVMSQFALIMIVASLRLITYSYTIDEMKALNEELRWLVFRPDWISSSLQEKQIISTIIHRCQIPLVTVNGRTLNIMSLHFFAKFIYTTVSHLATLHAIIERSRSAERKDMAQGVAYVDT